MMKRREEIDEMLERLDEEGENYCSGMSYYDGVKAALEWIANYTDEEPVEDLRL